ncbi:MAG: ribonuclease HII [Pseudomonadota bacterium]
MIIATKIKPNFLIEEEWISSNHNPFSIVVGIDEAGRGPLAGPVVAASAILDKKIYPQELNDSKKLSSKARNEIFLELINTIKFGIGVVDEKTIDKINILNATKLAMQLAFENLCQKYQIIPDMVLVDGNFIPNINCSAKAIIKGDSKSLSIAAASVIAKETRDEIMTKLDSEFPQYNWQKNKGYPTQNHYEMIKKFGICQYHRQSFTLFK